MDRLARRPRRVRITPATVISIVALIAAVGGSAVAAQRAAAPTKITACITRAGVYMKSRANGTCAAGQTKQSWGITGPRGLTGFDGVDGKNGTNGTNGTNGAPGVKGDTGDKGERGPGAFAWSSVTAQRSTSSATPAEFSAPNPNVTVTVESSRLVELLVSANLLVGIGATASVHAYVDGSPATVVGCSGSNGTVLSSTSNGVRRTSSTDCTGVPDGTPISPVFLDMPAGTHTIALRFATTGGITSAFADVTLYVAPR
jgi:hypothetical protein